MIAPQQRLFFDDVDVAVEIVKLGQPVIERDQVAESIDRLQLAMLHQLVCQRDAVNLFAAFVQFGHAQENALVLFQAEIVRGDVPAACRKAVSSLMIAPSTKRSASRLSGSGRSILASLTRITTDFATLAIIPATLKDYFVGNPRSTKAALTV